MNYKRPSTPIPPKLPPLKEAFKGRRPELKDDFIFKNNNNYREPLLFQKKINYTHNDIIELLEKLDNLWLEKRPKYDYIS